VDDPVADHLSQQTIDGYRERRLPTGELLALDEHLAGCYACRERLREATLAIPALMNLRASLNDPDFETTGHLSEQQAADYAANKMRNPVDVELVESHVEYCGSCGALIEKLRVPPTVPATQSFLGRLGSALFPAFGGLRQLSRVQSVVAMVAVVAISIGIYSYRQQDSTPRGPDVTIRAAILEGQSIPRDNFVLRWSGGPPGTRYDLAAAIESNQPDWSFYKSGLEIPEYRIPTERLAGLATGTVIQWRVQARLKDGNTLESPTFNVAIK
jgi:hypothetical protein